MAEGQPQQVEPFIVKVSDCYAALNKDAFTVGAIRTLGTEGWTVPLTWSGAVGAPTDAYGNGLANVEFMATVEMGWGFAPSKYTKDWEIQGSIDLDKNRQVFELLKSMEKIKLDLVTDKLLGPDNKGPLAQKSVGFDPKFLNPEAFRIGRWCGENKPWSEKEIKEDEEGPQEGKGGSWKKGGGGFKKSVKMDERPDDKKGDGKKYTWYLSGRKEDVPCTITTYSPAGVPTNTPVPNYLEEPMFLKRGNFTITFAALGINLVDTAMGKSNKSQSVGIKYVLTGVYLDMKTRPLAPPKAAPMSAMQRLALTESKGTFRIDKSRAVGAGAPLPVPTPAPGRAENGEPASKKRKAEGAPE